MDLDIPKLVRLWLPSLWLLFSVAVGDPAPGVSSFRQSFGSADHYLDLYFVSNPDGLLQMGLPVQKVRFRGYWVSGDRQEGVEGYFVRRGDERLYTFDGTGGRFEGRLMAARGKCQPRMDFRYHPGRGKKRVDGALNAAFCIR